LEHFAAHLKEFRGQPV